MRNDYSSNYLAHHGILGMKWGIRNYQNTDGSLTAAGRERYGVGKARSTKDISSAKGITKRLNALDSAMARNRRAISDNKRKGDNYYSASKRAKTDEKHDKLNRKADEQYAKNKKYEENLKKGQAEIDDLLNKAADMGYDIDSKMTIRNTATGKDFIKTMAINMVTMPLGMMYMESHQMAGTKYKVSDTEESIKKSLERKGYDGNKQVEAYKKTGDANYITKNDGARDAAKKIIKTDSDNISKKVSEARKTGMYDMEFLERNLDLDPVTEKQLTGKALDDAYEKYLRKLKK